MVLGQVVLIDEDDRWHGLSGVMPPQGGGILSDFLEREAEQQLTQFPAVVARRDAYETVGGYCTFFNHVTDWDMFFRLAQLGPVASVARPYAGYRVHGASETSRVVVSGLNMRETYFLVRINEGRMNASDRALARRGIYSRMAETAEVTAWELDGKNCLEGRYNQARWAWMLEPTIRRLILVVKSWLKHKLGSKGFFGALSRQT